MSNNVLIKESDIIKKLPCNAWGNRHQTKDYYLNQGYKEYRVYEILNIKQSDDNYFITPTLEFQTIQWEYNSFEHDSKTSCSIDALNKLGIEGWELVYMNSGSNSNSFIFYMKRQKR